MKKILSCVLFVGFLTENVYASKNDDRFGASRESFDIEDWLTSNVDDENKKSDSPVSIVSNSPTIKDAALKALDAGHYVTARDLLRDICIDKPYSEKLDGAIAQRLIIASKNPLANQDDYNARIDIGRSVNERRNTNSPKYGRLYEFYKLATSSENFSSDEIATILESMESVRRGDKFHIRLPNKLYSKLECNKSLK